MKALAALLWFEIRDVGVSKGMLAIVALLTLAPFAIGVSKESINALQGVANTVTIFGVPSIAIVLAVTPVSSRRSIVAAPIPRAVLIWTRLVSILLTLLCTALCIQGAVFLARSIEGAENVRAMAAPAAVTGRYAIARDGQTCWLFAERDHAAEIRFKGIEAAQSTVELRIPFFIGPGNRERQVDEDAALTVDFAQEGDDWQPARNMQIRGSLAHASIPVRSGRDVRIRIAPGRSDYALGLRPERIRMERAQESSMLSGLRLSLAVVTGASVVVAAGFLAGSCMSRLTAMLVAMLALTLGLFKSSLGVGARIAFSDLLSARALEVIAGSTQQGTTDPGSPLLDWYPDLSFDNARRSFDNGLAIDWGDAFSQPLSPAAIVVVLLLITWTIVRYRDERPTGEA